MPRLGWDEVRPRSLADLTVLPGQEANPSDPSSYPMMTALLPKAGGLFGSGWARFMADRQGPDAAEGYSNGLPSTRLPAPSSAAVSNAVARQQAGGRSPPPIRQPPPTRAVSPPQQPVGFQGLRYGQLYAPAPDDLADLRRQQAEFARITRDIDINNSWLAIPALAPGAAVFGLEGAAALAGRPVSAGALQGPLNFVDREAWQRGAQGAAQALGEAEKKALRAAARLKFARANGISASEMQAEVHHSDPLEWAHLKPNADPNRLANLWGLRGAAHDIATREWATFGRALEGRVPTQAELMQTKLRIDRMVEAYIRRAGVPRSNTPPRGGGPI